MTPWFSKGVTLERLGAGSQGSYATLESAALELFDQASSFADAFGLLGQPECPENNQRGHEARNCSN